MTPHRARPARARLAFRLRGRTVVLLAAILAVGLGGLSACGHDPFAIEWEISPDTVELYSIARPEIGLPNGFNFYNGLKVTIEAASSTGRWDIALGTKDGGLVLLPPGALGVTGAGKVAALQGVTFDGLTEAPADTTVYEGFKAVPVRMGTVYAIRTNQTVGSFGTFCVYYAKLAPLDIDVEAGKLRFVFDASPVCNDRSLIPKD